MQLRVVGALCMFLQRYNHALFSASSGLDMPSLIDAIIIQAEHARRQVLAEPRLLQLTSPCHVLGKQCAPVCRRAAVSKRRSMERKALD